MEQSFVGGIGDDGIDAERGEELCFAIGPGERRRRLIGTEDADGVRIESENDGGAAALVRFGEQALDDLLVALMDAVEITNGDGAAASGIGQSGEVANEVHGSRFICHYNCYENTLCERNGLELLAVCGRDSTRVVGVPAIVLS